MEPLLCVCIELLQKDLDYPNAKVYCIVLWENNSG